MAEAWAQPNADARPFIEAADDREVRPRWDGRSTALCSTSLSAIVFRQGEPSRHPGQDKAPGGQLNEFQEVGIKAAYTIDPVKLQAAFFYSPNYFGRSGDGYYVEGGVDVTAPLGFTVIGRLGYQWIERNLFFGTPDYLWYAVGVQREIFAGVNVAVGFYGTDISKRDCAPVVDRASGGQRICGQRALVTFSRAF